MPVPEQRPKHLLLKHGLGWRGQPNPLFPRPLDDEAGILHVRQVEQLKEAIDRVAVGPSREPRVPDRESARRQLPAEPMHLRQIRGRFLRDNHVHMGRLAENPGETPEHSIGGADDFDRVILCNLGLAGVESRSSSLRRGVDRSRDWQSRIGLVQPGRDSDPAGHAVQFRNAETGIRQQQIGSNHPRQIILEFRRTLPRDQLGRLAQVQPMGNPLRLLSRHTQAIEQIDRSIELQENPSERLQLPGQVRLQTKWSGCRPPGLSGEQTARRKPAANKPRAF